MINITQTLRAAMATCNTRTIGRIAGNGADVAFVLKALPRTGCVVGCIREGSKLVTITGRFADNRSVSHLIEHTREFTIADGCTLTIAE